MVPLEGDGKSIYASLSPSIVEAVAGLTAGIVATSVVHPLDLVKTRLQVDVTSKPRWGGSVNIVKNVLKTEGSIRGLYRGMSPNLLGNSVSWGLYFLWYHQIKDAIKLHHGVNETLSSFEYFAASGTSGVFTALVTNPIWVLRTRMLSTGRNAPGAYRSMPHGVREILQKEGVLGFYRGLLPSLFGVGHGAVQFSAYEQLKNYRARQRGGASKLTNWDFLATSAAAKMIAGSITYPYQVLRARLQNYDAGKRYKSVLDVVVQVAKQEGLRGFYKGILLNIVRVLPSTCVTFLVYENTKHHLPIMYDAYLTEG